MCVDPSKMIESLSLLLENGEVVTLVSNYCSVCSVLNFIVKFAFFQLCY